MSLDTNNMNDKQKAALGLIVLVMMLIPVIVIAASIAVGCIFGAGYGWATFAALIFIFAVYSYINARVQARKGKEEQEANSPIDVTPVSGD